MKNTDDAPQAQDTVTFSSSTETPVASHASAKTTAIDAHTANADEAGAPPPTKTAGSANLIIMATCYSLGTFTDNFFKQSAVLLAATVGLSWVQSIATVLFALPFILFSAGAGWLADRTVKKHIIIIAKSIELFSMVLGAFFLLNHNWFGVLFILFCMGLQATLFSPAINGSIPEIFPAAKVPQVNSFIKLASTISILVGIAGAGVFLDRHSGFLTIFGVAEGPGYGLILAGVFMVFVGVLGLITALTLQRRPPAVAQGLRSGQFPWSGPLDSWRHLLECRKDPQLFLALLAEGYFYGVAAVAVVSVANIAAALEYSATIASLLSASLMLGIAFGALFAGRYPADSWKHLLFPSAVGMSLCMILTGFAPLIPHGPFFINMQLAGLWLALLACGICGGIYLIPLASFIQVRPAPEEKGKVLGISNFFSFVAIAVWGAFFSLIGLLPPAITFIIYGLATLCFALTVMKTRLRRMDATTLQDAAGSFSGFFLRGILALRYRVTETGLGNLPMQPGRPILFLPNHPALIDPVLVYSRIAGLAPRPLADENQMRGFAQGIVARGLNAITIPDAQKEGRGARAGIRKALTATISALQQGDNVLLYPSGKLYRSSHESLASNSAVAQILAAVPNVRIVLVRSSGLWGSSFSYAQGMTVFMKQVLHGIRTIFSNAILFTPKRPVSIDFFEPNDFPRSEDKRTINEYMESYYNALAHPALGVPYAFWRGRAPYNLPELQAPATSLSTEETTAEIRNAVTLLLRTSANLPDDFALSPQQSLTVDLGIDSLTLMEVATALETEFGQPVSDLSRLITVGDCFLAADGKLFTEEEAATQVPPAWFAGEKEQPESLALPHATAVHAFLHHARKAPQRAFLADKNGIRTRFQVLTGALILARRFAALPGTRLGIMLPAAPATTVVWLAAQLAGKEPVMLNWTVGLSNLRHCISLAEVTHVITATPLMDQLEQQGIAPDALSVQWITIDTLTTTLSRREKLLGAVRSTLHCRGIFSIATKKVRDIAAILFTSGSESNPKGVPLSHTNVVANARDVAAVLGLQNNERILAMLPPFHSFGFLVGVTLPLGFGLATACHPNPTQTAPLVFLVRDYKLSLLGATPTFLNAILTKAKGSTHLQSLRYAFVGAEKCPESVYAAFAAACPTASLCEGYGITECSPVISVNQPAKILAGSIGHPLPSLQVALVKEIAVSPTASSSTAEAPALHMTPVVEGESGMLLVRGPSIFAGYLGKNAPNPFVSYDGATWYRTGDLVRSDNTGRLTFTGRLKRFVKIGGEMISLPQLEEVLLRALGQRSDIPDDGKPWLGVEVRPSTADEKPEILVFSRIPVVAFDLNRLLREAGLSALHAIHGVVDVQEIPVLGTGKTDYRALQALCP